MKDSVKTALDISFPSVHTPYRAIVEMDVVGEEEVNGPSFGLALYVACNCWAPWSWIFTGKIDAHKRISSDDYPITRVGHIKEKMKAATEQFVLPLDCAADLHDIDQSEIWTANKKLVVNEYKYFLVSGTHEVDAILQDIR
jgi:hypothetical protein